jgi:hypothetical protein
MIRDSACCNDCARKGPRLGFALQSDFTQGGTDDGQGDFAKWLASNPDQQAAIDAYRQANPIGTAQNPAPDQVNPYMPYVSPTPAQVLAQYCAQPGRRGNDPSCPSQVNWTWIAGGAAALFLGLFVIDSMASAGGGRRR